jgi:serpin B
MARFPQNDIISLIGEIPRYDLGESIGPDLRLSDVLRAMGVRLAFDMTGLADFSGLSAAGNLAISEVIHKARVDVTEEGTEAAAATGMALRAGAMFREPPAEIFLADHPFLFVIRCRGTLLFAGRLVQPG